MFVAHRRQQDEPNNTVWLIVPVVFLQVHQCQGWACNLSTIIFVSNPTSAVEETHPAQTGRLTTSWNPDGHRRLMLLLLRALPGTWGVDLEVGKWDLGCTALHGVEPWKASWHRVQKSKRQLRRVHVALWVSAECFAGEPQRLQGRRDSCCFRLLAAWK